MIIGNSCEVFLLQNMSMGQLSTAMRLSDSDIFTGGKVVPDAVSDGS